MRKLLLLFPLLLLQACPFMEETDGTCDTEEGPINTYNIVGVWKQLPNEENQAEMRAYEDGKFYLLYVIHLGSSVTVGGTGTATDDISKLNPESNIICEKLAQGGTTDFQGESAITKFGTWYSGFKYFNASITNNFTKATVRHLKANDDPRSNAGTHVRYTFSGACGKTKLHLNRRLMNMTTDPDADDIVTYELYGLKPPGDACAAEPTSAAGAP